MTGSCGILPTDYTRKRGDNYIAHKKLNSTALFWKDNYNNGDWKAQMSPSITKKYFKPGIKFMQVPSEISHAPFWIS